MWNKFTEENPISSPTISGVTPRQEQQTIHMILGAATSFGEGDSAINMGQAPDINKKMKVKKKDLEINKIRKLDMYFKMSKLSHFL